MLSSRACARSLRPTLIRQRTRAIGNWRQYASVTDLARLPQPGTKLHGFTLNRTKHVPELELSALHFTHDQTGAEYLHVARDDSNNVFSIGFKTNPPDATGVPHILEHVTLCGSEKYPVRDPFFKMLPRSLQNFMNAFTSSDHTTYPFATTNVQDYNNLMSVYLDATLHPLLKRSDFVQEGWRVGPENPSDESASQELVFKGVVYNEMKGQMSDATYLFYIRFMEHIFPSLNNSGGDPAKITDLTYEQLKSFHQEHYHPSNSKILTYGDQSVDEHLKRIGEQLAKFGKIDIDRDIKTPIKLENGAEQVVVKGPVDPLTPKNAQYKTSTTWLMGDTTDIAESFALRIASTLLLDGYGSPLYRSLIESGLGSDFTPNTGYDTSGPKGIFSVGLNGVTEERVDEVKKAIDQTVQETVSKGFDQHKVDGLLHQMELGLKHKTASFGMGLIQRLKPGWFNGIDPFDALAWNSILEQFKAKYAQGRYLEGLVTKYLMVPNTLTFTMVPSETFGADLAQEESNRLQNKIEAVVKTFSSADEAHESLRARELELVAEQESGHGQSLDCLPTLRVSDIPRQQKEVSLRHSQTDNNVRVQWRETATNGLTYFKGISLLKDLPNELRSLVPLFCDSLMRIGTRNQSMEQIEDLIKLNTGGISFGHHASTSPSDTQLAEEGLSLSGFAFDNKVAEMYQLIQSILAGTDFDLPQAHKMIQQLVQTSAAGAVDGVAESGHAYARRYAEAGVTPHGWMMEQTSGLTQVGMITKLAAAEENIEAMNVLILKLKQIQSLALDSIHQGNMRIALTCGSDAATANESSLVRFLNGSAFKDFTQNLPAYSNMTPAAAASPAANRTFFPFPFQVSYTGLALPTLPYTSPNSPPLAVLAQLLTHNFLHAEIREKGGAYGAGAYSRGLGGVFGMYSYRDPTPEKSLTTMERALSWAVEKSWTPRELEEAKLSIFQGLDRPEGVNQEGMVQFLSGIEPALEQERRERLLDVGADQVRGAAEELAGRVGEARVAVLGKLKGGTESWEVKELAALES